MNRKKTTQPQNKVSKQKTASTSTTIYRPVRPSTTYADVVASSSRNTQDVLNETLNTILQKLNSLDERLKVLEYSGKGAIPKIKATT